ncbi:GMC family oxidoreductase N-terminal domain-containing protein [Nocardioides sp. WS12]|uniref:GMC family oxidoreductase n=1 Tax=Nocardioides sp. WS12 TaxID=2486272 RepID=UPI0015FDDEC4|nr:GMC family oxidoreductase N-terminal domain-containing protein [Nocardioides sp. WS12]
MASYDYIVVGSGSAGAVVAGRLSENPSTSVLLIEAGGTKKPMSVKIPAAFPTQFKTDLDWEFYTEPEPHLDGRVLYQPRAKYLGGCTGMNAMIYMRGSRHDYDDWAKGGATGWSYDEVLPLFKRSENNARGANEFHGASGPLHIEDLRSPTPFTETLIDAMCSTGMPRNDDFNGADQVGAGYNQVTHKKGMRWTTADGYVVPAMKRPNFTVLSEAHVQRLRIEGGRVMGVEVKHGGREDFIRADREVVLSAGAFNTPHLLMLSGIGPADHLAEHGIAPVVDNPNVGAHLMDHPLYLTNHETTMKGTLAEAESPIQLVKYLAARRGMLTSNIAEAGGFFHTRSDEAAPDVQMFAAPAYFWDNGFAKHDKPAYALALSLVGSKSRGQLRLKSADPSVKIGATFNYFAERADMDSMVAGIERAREVAAYGPLRAATVKELHPGAGVATRAELEAEVRRNVAHTYHPACTARIGTESDGVVDADLRVHGVTGLRVADASVFPTIPHGNTHAPTVLVGEKAADLIRATN